MEQVAKNTLKLILSELFTLNYAGNIFYTAQQVFESLTFQDNILSTSLKSGAQKGAERERVELLKEIAAS